MKQFFSALIFLFVILLLFKCVDEKLIEPGHINPDENYAELTIRLGKVTTKADDDIPATNEEKKIESLACFIQTFDEGIIGQEGYKPGVFLKLFSHEAKGSVNGFTDFDFDSDPPTVKLRIQSQGFKDLTKLVFISNYEQNGLKDALMAVDRMDDLGGVRTPEVTTAGIKYPLLMVGILEVPLSNQSSVTNQEVILTRIMARIDIQNNANTGDKPFVLQSAEVLNPKLYSYLMEGNDESYDIPVLSEGFAAIQAGGNDKIEGLYTYETANDGSVEHTAVVVHGTIKGEKYMKRIDMHTAGQPVPLGRNKLYQIVLNKTGDSQDISFTFKVDDWNDGVSFPVRPDHNKPVLEGLTFSQGFDSGRWNEAEALYNMENQPVGQISFSVTGRQQIAVKISEAVSYSQGSTSNLEDIVDIRITDPILNANGTITQHITLDFATAGVLQNKEPVDLSIQVYNIVKPSYNQTIHITNLLNYPGTNFKPVWFGGNYWAPVNIGQTVLETSEQSNNSIGNVFQWGRNTPFWLYPGLTDDQITTGPLPYSEANNAVNSNKFIKTLSNKDWLGTNVQEQLKRNNLWNNGNENDNPCPSGWRVVNLTDAKIILTRQSDKIHEAGKCRFYYKGDDGQLIYFPYTGHLHYMDGRTIIGPGRSLSWISFATTVTEDDIGSYMDIYTDDSRDVVTITKTISWAFTVRCIRK